VKKEGRTERREDGKKEGRKEGKVFSHGKGQK
jgi:hypothetical protein